jgi:hypothetical protein
MYQNACKPLSQIACVAALGLLVTACGGGGGSSSSSGTGNTPTPASTTLTGTAATGAAIANGTVTAHCVTGTATTTTAADGSFTLDLSSGQTPPCMLQVTKAGTPPIELYGFANSSGHVNITTLTDMALAKALGATNASTAFGGFNSTTAATLNSALPAAITYVQTQFAAVGLGAPSSELLTAPFSIGDSYDQLLDNLGAALLGAGKTYADWIAAVKQGASLITVVPPTPATDLTVPATLLALPVTGGITYISDAAVLTGLTGSHSFGRGTRRSTVQTSIDLPPSSLVSDCTVSVTGGNLILSADGQQVQASLTPSTIPTTTIQRIYATVYPTNVYGTYTLLAVTSATGSVFLNIRNGVVTEADAVDATTQIGTYCGTSSGGNQNSNRDLDVLTLPAGFVSDLATAALPSAPYSYSKAVTATDLTGVAAAVNFGLGTLTSFNADATVNTVLPVDDCHAAVDNGTLHLSSAAAAFDQSYPISALLYIPGSSTHMQLSGHIGTAFGKLNIDVRTSSPFLTGASGYNASGAVLICPYAAL